VHRRADLFVSSGDIPRQTSYETGLAGHHTRRGDEVVLDPEIRDERLLLANVGGRGTTVLTACSHAGVAEAFSPTRYAPIVVGSTPSAHGGIDRAASRNDRSTR
jgi:metal-dependent hydrolase (beta-lactamase superfamily II)